MKSKFQSLSRYQVATRGLLVGYAVFFVGWASAAIPVGNWNFENSLTFAGANWAVVYVSSGSSDFAIHGRSARASYTHGGSQTGYGGALKPHHDGPVHAYLTQTISNLTVGASYAVTNWMLKPGQGDEGWYSGARVYLEAIGGQGSTIAEYLPDPNLVKQVWQNFAVTNTPNANGQIEIRLHFSHDGASGDKWTYIDGWYDDVGVTALSSQPVIPPYKILSFALANQTATMQWETVSNQVYRIEASADLSSSNWITFQDNLLATGTNITFTTNVTVNPQYFRIHRL